MEHRQELGRKEPTRQEIQKMKMQEVMQQDGVVEDEQEVAFFHDFIAGGIAGSASVVVGHPMDTLKVRMQTAKGNPSMATLAIGSKYGGPATLFRGMAAPLSSAAAVNAVIFSSYGWSTRLYEQYSPDGYSPFAKSFTCGCFAGLVQSVIICPMEHVKCRLQIQETVGSAKSTTTLRTITRDILKSGGSSANISALYRGWWITCWREVPAFGAYFSFYDLFNNRIQQIVEQRGTGSEQIVRNPEKQEPNQPKWFASVMAGGLTGAFTWGVVYPFDVIKTQIQTAPINTPKHERTIAAVTSKIIKEHGWKHLFRGLTITCLRAFPVNGIIFPVYEFMLLLVCRLEL